MSGWLKLHRKIRDNPLLRDEFNFTLFVLHLLLEAQFNPYTIVRRDTEIHLNPGQLHISLRSLARKMKVGEKKIRGKLNVFKNGRMIDLKTDALGTIVTICNWEIYQEDDKNEDAPRTHPRTHPGRTQDAHKKKEKNVKKESIDSEPRRNLAPSSEGTALKPDQLFPILSKLEKDGARYAYPDQFNDFWEAYSERRKADSKPDAYKAWRKAVVVEKLDTAMLIACAEKYAAYCRAGNEPPLVATWFNKQRWNSQAAQGAHEPTRKSSYGLSSAEELAASFVRNNGFGGFNDPVEETPKLGQGDGQHPDSQERPGSSGGNNGRGLPEIPTWFDQDGDR